MNCKYCQQPLKHIYEPTPLSYLLDLMCYTCNTHFEYVISDLEELILTAETFYNIRVNAREFEVKFRYYTGVVVKRLMDNPRYGEPMEPMYIKSEVFTLKTIPNNWTPFNVKSKLEKLLPFI
jgi:hypothetical protein